MQFMLRRQFAADGMHGVLWRYWLQLFDAAADIPYRAAFQPTHVVRALPHIAISEYIDADTQRIRLAGSAHEEIWGRNITGTNVFDHLPAELAAARKHMFATVLRQRCAGFSEEVACTHNGRLVSYSGLFLPLRTADGAVKLLIGTHVYQAVDEILQELTVLGTADRKLKKMTFIDLV